MGRAHRQKRQKGEPTLPLINIVFLMLIFFMVSAQLSRPIDPTLKLVETDDPNLVPPPDAVILTQAGDVLFRGQTKKPEEIVAQLRSEQGDQMLILRILPDRRSDAVQLTELGTKLQTAGAKTIRVVTQRALQ